MQRKIEKIAILMGIILLMAAFTVSAFVIQKEGQTYIQDRTGELCQENHILISIIQKANRVTALVTSLSLRVSCNGTIQ